MTAPVLRLEEVGKTFVQGGWWRRRHVPAVRGVSLEVPPGRTLALVGESGSGKSTVARLALRLLAPDRGRVWWGTEEVGGLPARALRPLRRRVQMVFQDPYASLNPRMRVGEAVGEGLRVHEPGLSRAERRARVEAALAEVGLPASAFDRWPHEFSGGQRQRIGIARALILRPQALVLDEPTSALDVSVQAQIVDLLLRLQREHGTGYLFITHDLALVRWLAARVAVMFAGRIVEEAPLDALFAAPRHPYTQALLDAQPAPHPSRRRRAGVRIEEAPPAEEGCPFAPRCPRAREDCRKAPPPLVQEGARRFACLHPLP